MNMYLNQDGEEIKEFDHISKYLGSNRDNSEFKHFVVKNLNCLHISFDKKQTILTWCPSRNSEACIAAAIFQLADNCSARCLVQTYDNENDVWSHRIFSFPKSFNNLIAFIASMMDNFCPKHRRAPLSVEVVAHFIKILPILEFWKHNQIISTPEAIEKFLSIDLKNRYLLVRDTPTWGIVLDKIGKGMPPFAYNNLVSILGKPFDNQPDRSYAQSCIEAYRCAAQRREPIVEVVEARVDWAAYGLLNRRYVRFVLPLSYRNGETQVLSSTVPFDGNLSRFGVG